MPDQESTTSATASMAVDSVNHPLFLHQNDHPGILLIAKKLTGSDNYNSWKRSMTIALSAKNKLKLINGEFTEPSANSELRPLWERANDMVISWILNTVSDQISNNLNFVSSAFALWRELHEHYSQLDGHRIFQITHELNQLTQSNTTVEVYYHKIKGLWDEIDALEAPYACVCPCTCENGKNHGEREQRKRLIQFLMGLDESYTNIRGQILLMQPLPKVSKAYSMLRQEEKQRENPKPASTFTPITLNTMSYSQRPPFLTKPANNDRRNYTISSAKKHSNFRVPVSANKARLPLSAKKANVLHIVKSDTLSGDSAGVPYVKEEKCISDDALFSADVEDTQSNTECIRQINDDNVEKKNSFLFNEGQAPISSGLEKILNRLQSLESKNLGPSTPLCVNRLSSPFKESQQESDLSNCRSGTFSNRSLGMKQSVVQDVLQFLNSASKDELKEIPGIGEKRATYILELRAESPAPFKSLDDLQEIGLSEKQVKKMVEKVARDIFR